MNLAPILMLVGFLLFVLTAFYPTSDVNLKTFGISVAVILIFVGYAWKKVGEARGY